LTDLGTLVKRWKNPLSRVLKATRPDKHTPPLVKRLQKKLRGNPALLRHRRPGTRFVEGKNICLVTQSQSVGMRPVQRNGV
jgi:hypothetical protein